MKKYLFVMIFAVCLLTAIIKLGDVTEASPTKEYVKYYTSIKIARDDTLSDIAYNLYNNPAYDNELCWDSYKDLMNEIQTMNDLPSKNLIHAGNYIAIPYVVSE